MKLLPLRTLWLLAVLSTIGPRSFGQTEISDFGQFTANEFQIKECSFDPTADAVILFDKATSNYNDQYNLITDRRIRFKVLKEKGIDRGNIHISFYNKDKFEFVGRIEAIIATPEADGKITWNRLEQKSVYKRKLNEIYSEMVFAMPNVKVGSIIEYQYETTMEHYGGLRDWYFQKDIPVVLSSYHLFILPNTSFNYVVKKNSFMDIDVVPNKNNGSVLFEMKEIPGLRDEAYSTAYRDYLQSVSFQLSSYNSHGTEMKYSNNWKELNRQFMEERDFYGQIKKNLPALASLKTVSVDQTDAYQKMKFIYDYVRQNYSWDDIYSLYASGSLKTIVEKKRGNSADLNLLLINLLKDADIEVYPLLVSERDHGKVDTAFSMISQFDKVVAYVTIDSKSYVLDATDPYTPANMIPSELLNTIGFLVDKKNSGFIHLEDNSNKRIRSIRMNNTITSDGTVQGIAAVDLASYARVGKAEQYNSNKQKYTDQLTGSSQGLKIDSFKISAIEPDTAILHHDIYFSYPLSKSGSYYLANCNLFTGFDKNPFVADYRFTDIDFGTRCTYLVNGTFTVPDKFSIDALPKNMTLKTADNMLLAVREMTKTGNTVEVKARIEFFKSKYGADDYFVVKDFFGKMIDMLNEPIVLKAK
jgi:transglutaminase-like putative cysteine protease